jgi:ApaG protein
MYQATTKAIKVTVEPEFMADRSEPERGQYFWAYTVEISNGGESAVQLKRRHWIITDARGSVHEVKGAGVIGEEPIIEPGSSFRYTSGCPLETSDGFMKGHYGMIGEDGEAFEVEIPSFSLHLPSRRTLN